LLTSSALRLLTGVASLPPGGQHLQALGLGVQFQPEGLLVGGVQRGHAPAGERGGAEAQRPAHAVVQAVAHQQLALVQLALTAQRLAQPGGGGRRHQRLPAQRERAGVHRLGPRAATGRGWQRGDQHRRRLQRQQGLRAGAQVGGQQAG